MAAEDVYQEFLFHEGMSDEETAAIITRIFELGHLDSADEQLRDTYCVKCVSTGERHTITAVNILSLVIKAVGQCGKGFQISRGACTGGGELSAG